MIKTTIVALIAAASLVGVAAPAYADTTAGVFGYGDNDAQDWVADSVLTRLQQQGVNATSVDAWGGLVRAYVTQEDGKQVMQFYTPDSLTQVTL